MPPIFGVWYRSEEIAPDNADTGGGGKIWENLIITYNLNTPLCLP